jgi:transcriptional regulator with XRE-family HTH domain
MNKRKGGAALRERRIARGLEQKELSARCRRPDGSLVSQQTISRYEEGVADPTFENLMIIGAALGFSPSDLVHLYEVFGGGVYTEKEKEKV